MPYMVASIVAVTSVIVLLFSRYTADDSSIMAELEHMKEMFILVDGYVETFNSATEGNWDTLNFTQLNEGILHENSTINPADGTGGRETTMSFPNNNVVWQIIPNPDNENSSYKVLVNMTANTGLMAKARFSETFIGTEYCEKMLFGTFQANDNSYDDTPVGEEDFENDGRGSNDDGIFSCTVFK